MSSSEILIKHLFRKPEHGSAMQAAQQVELIADQGIVGDINSDRSSPRQVLVVNNQDLAQFAIPAGMLRENMMITVVQSELWHPGAKITFSSGAAIRLTFYCEPCKRIAQWVDSLEQVKQKRGILGVVVCSGLVELGDEITIQPNYFPALSEIPYERFLQLLGQIPSGKVITYKQVLTCIGVDRSYYRVLPLYLKKTPDHYPKHRVLDSQGKTVTHIIDQDILLRNEGIELKKN
ncbi:MAG: MGMT family protein, partial [Cyanobacteria bacterium J06642_3]